MWSGDRADGHDFDTVGNLLHFVQGFTWQHALVFGALISATDSIAVIAIFKNLGVPKRLARCRSRARACFDAQI